MKVKSVKLKNKDIDITHEDNNQEDEGNKDTDKINSVAV